MMVKIGNAKDKESVYSHRNRFVTTSQSLCTKKIPFQWNGIMFKISTVLMCRLHYINTFQCTLDSIPVFCQNSFS